LYNGLFYAIFNSELFFILSHKDILGRDFEQYINLCQVQYYAPMFYAFVKYLYTIIHLFNSQLLTPNYKQLKYGNIFSHILRRNSLFEASILNQDNNNNNNVYNQQPTTPIEQTAFGQTGFAPNVQSGINFFNEKSGGGITTALPAPPVGVPASLPMNIDDFMAYVAVRDGL
jgi:hypothetical protein